MSVSESIRDAFQGHPGWITVFRALTHLGSWPVLTVIVATASVMLLRQRRARDVAFLLGAWLGGELISAGVKVAIGKARPDIEHALVTVRGDAFPSGHTMAITIVAGALVLVSRVRGTALVVASAVAGSLVFLVGLSRIALGVHDLVDVAGGIALGSLWLAVCAAIWQRRERGVPTKR